MSFVFNLFILVFSSSGAQTECTSALDNARDRLDGVVQQEASSVEAADTNALNFANANNPLTGLMTHMQTMGQIRQQEAQQRQQLDQVRSQEREQIYTRLDELELEVLNLNSQREDALRQARSEKSRIIRECHERAQDQFNEFLGGKDGVNAQSAAGRFTADSITNARGTRARMLEMRDRFYDECRYSPATVELLNDLKDEERRTLARVTESAEKLELQREQLAARAGRREADLNAQERAIASQTDQASKQASTVGLLQTGFAWFTSMQSSRNDATTSNAARSYGSALHVSQDWGNIAQGCINGNGTYKIPNNIFERMTSVAQHCGKCIQPNGQTSNSAGSAAK